MESEKVAISALDVLRQRRIHDQAVKARLKNESFLKNLMKELNTSADGIPADFVVPVGVQPMMIMTMNGQPMMMPMMQPVYSQSVPATTFDK